MVGDDNVEPTYHERIMTAHEDYLPLETLNALVTELEKACDNNDCERIRDLLLGAPAGYQPVSNLADFVWVKQQNLTH